MLVLNIRLKLTEMENKQRTNMLVNKRKKKNQNT